MTKRSITDKEREKEKVEKSKKIGYCRHKESYEMLVVVEGVDNGVKFDILIKGSMTDKQREKMWRYQRKWDIGCIEKGMT